ncbi:MAG: tetratricopeptide repeat protein [Pseudomonadota bacterium]
MYSCLLGTVAQAQIDRDDLRSQQNELFQQLIVEPDNLDTMFEYARVSIQLEDFEAAISTLERMLIYQQDLSRVRLELAVAYFSLGSYEVADLYFDQVLADPATPETVRARIRPYKAAIVTRTRTNALSMIASVGYTFSTNASLGPDSSQVLLFGNNATLISGQQEEDSGVRVTLNVTHAYDLQGPDDDFWRTDFGLFGVRYGSVEAGDVGFMRLRTGPRLSLDNQQFGVKLRPYLEAQYLNSEDRGLFAAFALGAEVSDTVTTEFSTFGDAGIRYRNFFRREFDDEDTYNLYLSGGGAYLPTRDLVLRARALLEADFADERFNSNVEGGLRLSGEYQYDSGLDWIDRKWVLSGFLEGRSRLFNEPDPIVDPNRTRRDIDLRGGLSHVFAIREGFGIQLDADALLRHSNIVNFDLDNVTTTVSLQYRM